MPERRRQTLHTEDSTGTMAIPRLPKLGMTMGSLRDFATMMEDMRRHGLPPAPTQA